MINRDTRQRAMDLFVDYGYSIDKIVRDMELSKSTVSSWSIKGNWSKLRESKIAKRDSFIGELYDFSITIMANLKRDYNNGIRLDNSALTTLDTLLKRAEKLITLETEKKRAEKETQVENSIPPEVAAQPEVVEALRIITLAIEKFEESKVKK